MSLLLSGAALAVERPEPNEAAEPEPVPQTDLPAHSDYSEAKQLLNKRKWEEAAIVLRTVLKRNPELLPAAMDLARALAYSSRREEALGVLSQASIHLAGARRTALIKRVKVLSRLFFTQKTAQMHLDGLNLLQTGKYRLARERFDKALEQEPDNAEILTRIGQCLVLDGDYDSAAERLRIAKRLDPYEPEIRLWLGRAMHQRGELNESLDELKAAFEELDGSERAPLWYAEALVSSGSRKQAIQVLEDDGKAQPFHLTGLVTLARMRSQLSRDAASDPLWGARKDLQLALSRLPQYAAEPPRFESELGVELREPAAELKTAITQLLAQLDSRLKEPEPQPIGH